MKTKYLISLFFAVIAVALTMVLNASAAEYTWDQVVEGLLPSSDDTINVGDSSKGGSITIPAGVSVTVVGTTGNNLTVILESGASVSWQATVNSSGKVTINESASATGTSANFVGANIDTSATPALTIGAGVDSVAISNSVIKTSAGTAIQTYGGTITLSTATTVTGNTAVNVEGNAALTISGATIVGGDSHFGVRLANAGATLKMISGSISGNQAIFAYQAEKIEILGGTISGSGSANYGILSYATNTIISGGDISGSYYAVSVADGTVNITGGRISLTGSYGAAVYIGGSNAYTTTIGGTVSIDGGLGHGVTANNGSAVILITNGNIIGYNGIQLGFFGALTITGGTISGAGDSLGQGIRNGITKKYKIKPTASTPVTVKGKGQAIYQDGGSTPDLEDADYYFTSGNYDDTGKTAFRQSTTPFVNSTNYKYTEFLATAPSFRVTVSGGTVNGSSSVTVPADTTVNIAAEEWLFEGWTASGVTLANPGQAVQSFIMPLCDVYLTANFAKTYVSTEIWDKGIPDPIAYTEKVTPEWIEVVATLNKSGSVNSILTAEDVRKARNRADKLGVNKIKLIIPRGGTGISASAMKKVYKAAGNRNIYLTFDFYETLSTKETLDLGGVFIKLNSKSGQFLTKVYFKSALIDSAQKYISKKWKTDILGSFETANKGGWGDTAEVTASLEKLGLSADDGTRLYALIYDTKTKKWFQTQAIVVGDEVVVNTTRSGVFNIVNRPIN